jgi:hypothetical protein
VPVPGRDVQELLEFRRSPRLPLDRRDRSQSRCEGDERDVAAQEPAADGGGERALGQ